MHRAGRETVEQHLSLYETDRVTYLEALGVTNYMPRLQLPCAANAQLNAFLVPKDAAANQAHEVDRRDSNNHHATAAPLSPDSLKVSASEIGDRPKPASAKPKQPLPAASAMEDIAATLAATSPQVGVTKNLGASPVQTASDPSAAALAAAPFVPPAAQPSKADRASVNFSLGFWRVSPELMVVDSRQPKLALPVEKLLKNLLLALGVNEDLPKADVWQWPMIETNHHLQDADDAREALHAYLDTAFLLNPGKYLLCMGEAAARYILNLEPPCNSLVGQRTAIDDFGLEAFCLPSLTELLQDPLKKAITWRTIQSLAKT